ncbi:ArnT family glycosyltransferase [Patescibacteria group bacterium]
MYFQKLGPYTYWYDHFPLGWLLLGLWQLFTGGPFSFGVSVLSGRVFSIVLTSISTLFLYKITKKITKSELFSILAIILFALSPLSITLTRQVYLENIALPWLLLSIYLLVSKPKSGKHIIFSAASLGTSILIKESLLFFIPGYLVFLHSYNQKKENYKYLLFSFLLTLIFVLSLFPVLAIVKTELLPKEGQLSLTETVLYQAQRGDGKLFWQEGSDLRRRLDNWLFLDPYLIFIGLASTLINLLKNIKSKNIGIYLMPILFLVFLTRGKLVLDFYIIPLLPLMAFSISIFAKDFLNQANLKKSTKIIIPASIAIAAGYIYSGQYLYTSQATQNQIESISHLKTKISKDSIIAADPFLFLDLRIDNKSNELFKNIHWYPKLESDPQIKDIAIQNNFNNIDYILLSESLKEDLKFNRSPQLKSAFDNMTASSSFVANEDLDPIKSKITYAVEDLQLYKNSSINPLSSSQKINIINIKKLFILSLNNSQIPQELIDLNGQIGGVIIQESAIQSSSQLEELIKNLKTTNQSLFVFVRQEGGVNSPISWINTVSQASIKSPLEGYEVGLQRGKQLKNLGFDGIISPLYDNSLISEETGHEMIKGYAESGLKVIPILYSKYPKEPSSSFLSSYGLLLQKDLNLSQAEYPGLLLKDMSSNSLETLKNAFLEGANAFIVNDLTGLENTLKNLLEDTKTNQPLQRAVDSSFDKLFY